MPRGPRFVHDRRRGRRRRRREPIDWIEYRHWDPDRGRYAPVYDFIAYNGGDLRGENPVADLMLEADADLRAPTSATLDVADQLGGDRFLVTLPVGGRGALEVRRNGRTLAAAAARPEGAAPRWPAGRGRSTLEASAMDRRLTVAVDGALLFDPIDYDDPSVVPGFDASPMALGVRGGSVAVERPADLPRRLLHERPGQHPAPAVRRRLALPARAGRVLRAGRQQPGLERLAVLDRPARSCRASCSWASRSWSTCRARSSR